MKKLFLVAVLAYFFLLLSVPLFAGTPAVLSFNAPTGLESGQAANFAWTINGGGHSIILFCSQGLKLLYVSNNQTFPCDTRTSVSAASSDGVSVIVANVSGSPRILTARIIPKDSSGADYDAGAKEASVYVNPSRQPITNFYTTATTTVSGAATVFYWTSVYLDGVNFKIACNDSITATSSIFGPGAMPCGQSIFSKDLSGSGSASIQFSNASPSDLPFDVTLLPAMSPGIYDGTHGQTITLTVASDAQKPISLSYFKASRQKIFSGDSVTFSWSYLNAAGVNLKLSCLNLMSYNYFTAATTTALPCNDYVWQTPLAPVGTTSITFFNSGLYDQSPTVSLFPELKNMTYDGSKAASVKINVQSYLATSTATLTVSPQVQISPITAPTALSSPSLGPPTTMPTSAPSSGSGKIIFKRPLDIGSRGDDVKSLQIFLAKDKNLYPEGLTTGYFGPITARALGKFQLKYGLVKNSQEPAYGFVGPKTRAMLNSLQ